MDRVRLLAAVCLVAAGCTASPKTAAPVASPTPLPAAPPTTAAPDGTPGAEPNVRGAFEPDPDQPVPREPARLARQLARTTRALRGSIDAWAPGLEPSTARPPRALVLQALYQQRIYRTLARDPALADRTLGRLPAWLRGEARAVTTATANIFSLVKPVSEPSRFRTRPPPPAGVLLRYYRQAERRFGVDWEVLASLHHYETKFSRVVSDSSAGAQGPMQFIPSTWAAYGMGGDVHDDRDAILGAANYLRASGAPQDYRNAVYAYNRAWPYVDAVLLLARQMMRDPRDFFAYYSWQVFVITTKGDVRLTGPGLS